MDHPHAASADAAASSEAVVRALPAVVALDQAVWTCPRTRRDVAAIGAAAGATRSRADPVSGGYGG